MNKEVFFIVGCQRCGTSFAYELLDSQPEIFLSKPLKPEPKYFLNSNNYKIEDYYKTVFPSNPQEKIIGEKSTSYIESDKALSEIKNCFPEAKILICIRNPIDRAISNYFFSKKHGLETRTLEQVFLEGYPPPGFSSEISTNPFDYLKRGQYSNEISRVQAYFDSHKIHVIILEELLNDPKLSGKELLEFLGTSISKDSNFNVSKKVNEGDIPEIPKPVYNKLKKYYDPWNKKLEVLLGRKVSW